MGQHGRTSEASDDRQARMPAGIRRALVVGVALLMASALYLIAVRGEALLADLSKLSQAVIACF